MKKCFKCGIERPISDFYKHSKMRDGRLNKCKECTRSDVSKNRSDKLEYYQEYDRLRGLTEERKAKNREYQKTHKGKEAHGNACRKWRINNQDRAIAQNAVNVALRDGKLKKLPCIICGDVNTQGHHSDYSRPLDVMWLCVNHHSTLHREHRQNERSLNKNEHK